MLALVHEGSHRPWRVLSHRRERTPHSPSAAALPVQLHFDAHCEPGAPGCQNPCPMEHRWKAVRMCAMEPAGRRCPHAADRASAVHLLVQPHPASHHYCCSLRASKPVNPTQRELCLSAGRLPHGPVLHRQQTPSELVCGARSPRLFRAGSSSRAYLTSLQTRSCGLCLAKPAPSVYRFQ